MPFPLTRCFSIPPGTLSMSSTCVAHSIFASPRITIGRRRIHADWQTSPGPTHCRVNLISSHLLSPKNKAQHLHTIPSSPSPSITPHVSPFLLNPILSALTCGRLLNGPASSRSIYAEPEASKRIVKTLLCLSSLTRTCSIETPDIDLILTTFSLESSSDV